MAKIERIDNPTWRLLLTEEEAVLLCGMTGGVAGDFVNGLRRISGNIHTAIREGGIESPGSPYNGHVVLKKSW